MNNKLRVGIYLRLSNEDKSKINDMSESIKNQKNMLIDYINNEPNFILYDIYSDEDLSGAGTYRPEFERLIKDCENKKIDIVLCKSQSRFSRDMEIVEKYINNKFIEWNIRFIGLSDNADTLNHGNKKARQINGLVNEWYLEDVSNNIKSAFHSKMIQGELISPFAPYGYMISKDNNNKLMIDEEAASIVKKIYYLFLKGFGFTSICNYLNNKNIPSPSLYKYQKNIKLNIVSKNERSKIKWNPNAIKTILSNEVYIGNLIQGKRTTISYKNHKVITKDKNSWIKKENTHDAIIDIKTFNKVKEQLLKRSKPLKKTNTKHIFSGVVFCIECNHSFRKKSSGKNNYLVCSNPICNNKRGIRYDFLEKLVLNEINKIIDDYYDIKLIKNCYKKNNTSTYTNKINFLMKKKEEIKTNINNNKNYLSILYEDKVNKIITNKQFKYLLNNHNEQYNNLIKQKNRIDNEIDNYKNKISNDNLINKYKKIKSINKIIINEFIDKIYINKPNETNNRNIIINWNF